MGKGKDPWDDSALVDAFDRAVASFKEAHFQKGGAVSAEHEGEEDGAKPAHGAEGEGEDEDSTNRNVSDEHMNQDDKVASKEETQDDEETLKGNDDAKKSYDELLKQFYELEEKRQAVLQQIYKHPDYYDQTTQPDACNATAPEHASQDPRCLNSACVGYCLPVSVVPVPVTGGNSCGACNPCFSICQPCDKCPDNYAGCNVCVPCTTNPTKQSHDMDHSSDLKKGIMVAESAMRVINSNISGKESETVGINESLQAIGISDADLLPVLNAWYSAGFQTARYLMGKSQQNTS